MSACTIVLDVADAHQIDHVTEFLTASGIQIESTDKENGVIECTGEASLIKGLEKHELFSYIRVHLTYAAEFPPGHPLDTNGV
jgi:3-deoxy-D-arabino-heptulosonate 7-phosphate (DAHP) synthase class II